MAIFERIQNFTDAELVSKIASGDEKAFRELLSRHQKPIFDFATRFLGSETEAADMAQETFLRLFRTSATYRPGVSLRAFLLRIVRNLCIDHVRKKRPVYMQTPPEQAHEDTPHAEFDRKETAQALAAAIRCLPENQRTAVLLRHETGLAYAEIAEAMNLSVSAVESLLVRGRRTLKQSMAPLMD